MVEDGEFNNLIVNNHLTVEGYLTIKTPDGLNYIDLIPTQPTDPNYDLLLQITKGIQLKEIFNGADFVDIQTKHFGTGDSQLGLEISKGINLKEVYYGDASESIALQTKRFYPDPDTNPDFHISLLEINKGWIRAITDTDESKYIDIRAITSNGLPVLQIDQGIQCQDTGIKIVMAGDILAGDTRTKLEKVNQEDYNPEQYTIGNNYSHLFCTMISPLDRSTVLPDPKVATDYAFFVEKDFQTFGFVGTSSDPLKGAGGSAIMMGQGFTGLYCPPMFDLTGLLSYPSGLTLPSTALEGEFFWKTDTKVLYRRQNEQWVNKGSSTALLGGYPSGSSLPGSGENGQWYYVTGEKKLYQYWTTSGSGHSAGWNQMFSSVQSGDYDTLFLMRADGTDAEHRPASLHLGGLTATNAIYVDQIKHLDGSNWNISGFDQSLNTTNDAVFNSVKVISADGNPAHGATVKVGDSTHDYIALNYDTTYGYLSAHSKALYLSGDNGITVGSTMAFGNNSFTIASTSRIANLNADLLDGYHASSFVTSGSATTFSGISMGGNIIPTSASTYYCGSSAYPWQIVNTQYLYVNTLNSLSGSTITSGSALIFTPAQDQIRFTPSGYSSAIWAYKPSEGKLLGLWDGSMWKFYIDTSGNLQCYCNIFPASANNGNIGTDTNY